MTIQRTAVTAALRAVDDPEYPGISVIDMGMISEIQIEGSRVSIEVIPTFSGCPALEIIKRDITSAIETLPGCDAVTIRRSSKAWNPSRLTASAIKQMRTELNIAVAIPSRPVACPHCGENALVQQSPFGPTRCRAINRCTACNEIVELLRA